jgi:hypothetical protein
METYWDLQRKTGREIKGALAVMMVVTALFTYLGAYEALGSEGAGHMARVPAAIFALGSGTAGFIMWTVALGMIPTLPRGKSLLRGLGALALGLLMMVCLSSYLNVVAIGGGDAQRAGMFASVATYEAALGKSQERLAAAASLRPNLLNGAATFEGWAEAERTQGALTGSPGRGTVYSSAMSAAGDMEALADSLDGALGQGQGLVEKAAGHLRAMRAIAEEQGPVPERLGRFAAHSDRLRSILVEINSLDVAGALARDLERLAAEKTTMAPSARGAALADAQAQAVMKLARILNDTAAPLADTARRLATMERPDVPRFERISTVQAVWLHARAIVPLWAGGLALDLMPLILLLLLRIKRDSDDDTDVPADVARALGMTMADVLAGQKAIDSFMGRNATPVKAPQGKATGKK